jgi:PTH1 family peptidyl-tRNA hydrolase
MSKKTNYLFVGLGNPGEEYEKSRHSFGRRVLMAFVASAEGQALKKKFRFIWPDNFMNNSGGSVKPLIKTKKEAGNVVVIHDDLALPLGSIKISYNRGSGGHKGVDSIVKALKTNEFVRVRLGVSPTTPTGKLKKPVSDKVVDFIVGNFKPAEELEVKKVIKQAKKIIESLVEVGLDRTMNEYN